MQPALLTGITSKKAEYNKRGHISTEPRPITSPFPTRAQPHMFDEQLSQPIRIFQTLLQLLQEIAGRVGRRATHQTLLEPLCLLTHPRSPVTSPGHAPLQNSKGSLSPSGPMVLIQNLGQRDYQMRALPQHPAQGSSTRLRAPALTLGATHRSAECFQTQSCHDLGDSPGPPE